MSHGSVPSPTATLFSSRDRRGRTWGKVVLDSEQLSAGHTGDRREFKPKTGRGPCVVGCRRTLTSAVVQTLHERPQRFLVQDGALCVPLPQRRPRLLQTGNLGDGESLDCPVLSLQNFVLRLKERFLPRTVAINGKKRIIINVSINIVNDEELKSSVLISMSQLDLLCKILYTLSKSLSL